MENCKLIIFDLDKTLLRDDKTISDFTVETLNSCRKRGILIGFATARPVRGVEMVRSFFEPDILINHNGAMFQKGDKQEVIGIKKADLIAVLARIESLYPAAEVAVETTQTLYANYDVTKRWLGERYIFCENGFEEVDFDDVVKVLIDLKGIDTSLIRENLPSSCYMDVADGDMGMIMSVKATKMGAISAICEWLEIDLADVVAFGDDNNDILMIEGCGVGIAMENAIEMVKEVADGFCLSNEADGPAKWVLENVLEG